MINTIRRRAPRSRPRFDSLEQRALLSGAGSPDPSFGGTGSATISLALPLLSLTASYETTAESVITAPGGKVVVSGLISKVGDPGVSTVTSVARFNADGTVDTNFGIGGQSQLPVGPNLSFTSAVQSDGSIIEATGTTDPGGNATYLVVRLNEAGTLDTTFGTNGVAEYPANTTTAVADRLSTVVSVLLQSNGQIVLAGSTSHDFAAVRLNTNGALDTTYGQAGTALAPVTVNGFTEDSATTAAIQANGQVVVSGIVNTAAFFSTKAALARFNANGTFDTTFGSSGSVLLPLQLAIISDVGQASNVAVAVDPTDQKIVASARSDDMTARVASDNVYRFNTDGSTDTSFGANGSVVPIFSGYLPDLIENGSVYSPNQAGSLAVDSSGRILELLFEPAGLPGTATAIVRLNADGSTDKTFGNTTTTGPYQPGLKSIGFQLVMTIQPTTGDIILAGTGTVPTLNGRALGYTVAELLPSTGASAKPLPPTPPASFEKNGLATLDMTNPAVYLTASGQFAYRPAASQFTVTNHSADVLNPFGSAGVGQTIPAVADYLGIGTSQVAVYLPNSGTYAIQPIASVSDGLSLQFGLAGAGKSIPVPADYEGTGADDVAVYVPTYGAFGIHPSNGGPDEIIAFGTPGVGQSIPAPADYFGTGKADIAVYLAASGIFAIRPPTGPSDLFVQFGMPGLGKSIPVPDDYDGSGKIELAVYIPSLGEFIYRPANGGPDVTVPFGKAGVGELPVPGDYDGSGRTEVAVYDPTSGFFAYRPANGGNDVITAFGSANGGSIPVAAPSGSLPEFAASTSGSGSGTGVFRPSVSLPGSSPSASTSAVVAVKSSTVMPVGPTLASVRVTRSLINQGSTDSSKFIP